MKSKNISRDQKQKPSDDLKSAAMAEPVSAKTVLTPSRDAVAKMAYFSYLNGGSQAGQETKHWLEAEAHLFAGIEREMRILPR